MWSSLATDPQQCSEIVGRLCDYFNEPDDSQAHMRLLTDSLAICLKHDHHQELFKKLIASGKDDVVSSYARSILRYGLGRASHGDHPFLLDAAKKRSLDTRIEQLLSLLGTLVDALSGGTIATLLEKTGAFLLTPAAILGTASSSRPPQ